MRRRMERGGDPSMDLGGYAYSLLWGRARAYNLRRTPGEGESKHSPRLESKAIIYSSS